MLIALIGVDGSGKTTQARDLATWLTEQGTPARYFENAGGRPIIDAIARRVGRADGQALLGSPGRLVVESVIRWGAIARAHAWVRITGEIAVMDRYTYCQNALVAARRDRGGRVVRAAFSVFPAPSLVCFLAITPELAAERVAARGRDIEEPAYLRAFADAYAALREASSFVIIDASQPPAAVRLALRSAVLDRA